MCFKGSFINYLLRYCWGELNRDFKGQAKSQRSASTIDKHDNIYRPQCIIMIVCHIHFQGQVAFVYKVLYEFDDYNYCSL